MVSLEEITNKVLEKDSYVFPLIPVLSQNKRLFKIIGRTFSKYIKEKELSRGIIPTTLKSDAEQIKNYLSSTLPDYSFEIKFCTYNGSLQEEEFCFIEFKKSSK